MVKKSIRTSKFKNVKTTVDNITFHSKKEAKRYAELKLHEKSKLISDLRLQVKFELIPKLTINGKTERSISYVADFVYNQDGNQVVEDVKGMKTDVYKIKYRLMKLIHNVDIKES